jgi:hypothetical protein
MGGHTTGHFSRSTTKVTSTPTPSRSFQFTVMRPRRGTGNITRGFYRSQQRRSWSRPGRSRASWNGAALWREEQRAPLVLAIGRALAFPAPANWQTNAGPITVESQLRETPWRGNF